MPLFIFYYGHHILLAIIKFKSKHPALPSPLPLLPLPSYLPAPHSPPSQHPIFSPTSLFPVSFYFIASLILLPMLKRGLSGQMSMNIIVIGREEKYE